MTTFNSDAAVPWNNLLGNLIVHVERECKIPGRHPASGTVGSALVERGVRRNRRPGYQGDWLSQGAT